MGRDGGGGGRTAGGGSHGGGLGRSGNAVRQGLRAWSGNRAYKDNAGNYRLKLGRDYIGRRAPGKIAPWNKEFKRAYPNGVPYRNGKVVGRR